MSLFAALDLAIPLIQAPMAGVATPALAAAACALGAAAAQLGTAFVLCPESAADAGYRAALQGPGAWHTAMTVQISGRAARALANRWTGLAGNGPPPPIYPIAYAAGKALHAAARARGEHGFGAHWAGQGAPLARATPAATLVDTLAREYAQALG